MLFGLLSFPLSQSPNRKSEKQKFCMRTLLIGNRRGGPPPYPFELFIFSDAAEQYVFKIAYPEMSAIKAPEWIPGFALNRQK